MKRGAAIACMVVAWVLSGALSWGETPPIGPRLAAGEDAQSQPDAAAPLTSPGYSFVVLDFPGSFHSNGFGINSGAASSKVLIAGAIGNQAANPIGYNGGFLLNYAAAKGGATETFRAVNIPSAIQQAASSVNDSGVIVGYYSDSSGLIHGYSESGGVFSSINVPFAGATDTGAFGNNNAGDVVGYWIDATTGHGFLLKGGTYTSLDFPGAKFTIANAINNLGDIVGFYSDAAGVYHGFLLSGGTYTTIDAPGATATEINAINDSGDTVGLYCLTSECAARFDTFEGFVLSGGTFTTISIRGALASSVLGINNNGFLSGTYEDAVGRHGFLAVPK